ncbi:PcfJ domain-containing protein [Rhizobium sp. BK176]|uniref:PcfJ domain-containing protein n=1 Tax=Rhizobium sp. BK176 TaxID=2587071 RepID=UPI002167F0D8|nr:PcfJ domain-containing protein [Rhizobium sp. BK176]MCS4090142.1 hypothetical protein [Rhizobium sp. BK176]
MEDRNELDVRAQIITFTDDTTVRVLLSHCVGRIALRDYDRDTRVDFRRDRRKIMHITDWLTAEVIRSAPWLARKDDNGVPKKLLKFGSIDAIFDEANKAMEQAAARVAHTQLTEKDVQVVAELDNGYKIVRLLTPAALDEESRMMRHCIGNGAYDAMLADDDNGYFSLRDPKGGSHVTLEIEEMKKYRSITQLQGKGNTLPVRRYLDMLKAFIKEIDAELGGTPGEMGFIIDDDGGVHLLSELPEGITVTRDTDLVSEFAVVLPPNMTINGKLELGHEGLTELPPGLTVTESLDISNTAIRELPADLDVWGDIIADGAPLEVVPDHLKKKVKTDYWPKTTVLRPSI